MSVEQKPSTDMKTDAKRKSEALRQFVDKHVDISTAVTPEWQRAIDNYKRLKSGKSA